MPSIESLGYPLAYKVNVNQSLFQKLPTNNLCLRTDVRALEGMQKEALVYYGPSNTVWRMVSDEGPYLNGTDLAPFPLAFYTAGMAFSFMAEVLIHAATQNITFNSIELTQDNYYTMEGSAIRGDMRGGALPAELVIKIESDTELAIIESIVQKAVKSSPAQAYMRQVLQNTFSLTHNGENIAVDRVTASPNSKDDPTTRLTASQPQDKNPPDDVIVKLNSAETLFNVDGGAGSSLKSEQKRTLHVRGIVSQRDDGLLTANVQLFKPIGSTFRFLCDYQNADSPIASAPSPLAYLSAGVGFCFMTQVGRYATIVKQDLQAYRIVQDNAFTIQDNEATALPIDTHLFVEMNEPAQAAQQLLYMSEQTCFLHAAMRSDCPSVVKVQVNTGEQLSSHK